MSTMPVVYEDNGSPPYDNMTQQSIRTEVDSIETQNSVIGPVQYILRRAVYQIVQREMPLEPGPTVQERLEAAETLINLLLGEAE